MRKLLFLLVIALVVAACAEGDENGASSDAESTDAPETPTQTDAPGEVIDDDPFFAPNFTLTSLSGETYQLAELQDQWVVLNFWATWCEPCVAEMPFLQQISEDFADNTLMLGINMRETPEEMQPFLDELGITYPILVSPTDQTVLDYQVSGLPQTLVVDPHGEIVWRQFGPIELESFSEALTRLQDS